MHLAFATALGCGRPFVVAPCTGLVQSPPRPPLRVEHVAAAPGRSPPDVALHSNCDTPHQTGGRDAGREEAEALPLLVAAASGDCHELDKLLGQGAHVNARGPCGRTALLEATEGAHVEAVCRLLLAGADMGTADDAGTTPRAFALARLMEAAASAEPGAARAAARWRRLLSILRRVETVERCAQRMDQLPPQRRQGLRRITRMSAERGELLRRLAAAKAEEEAGRESPVPAGERPPAGPAAGPAAVGS
eukprot:scaffold8.g1648.t1